MRPRRRKKHAKVVQAIDSLEREMGLNMLTEDEMMQRVKYTQKGVLTDEMRADLQRWHRESHGL